MSDIDLRLLGDDEFVLHFGGRPNEVDAFTFSNALISIGEALREINRQVSPEFGIEIAIDGVGPGSFRARLKTSIKSLGGLFKKGSDTRSLIIGILSCIIYDRCLQPTVSPQKPPTIIINDNSVVIQVGSDRIIVPRGVWEAKEKLPEPKIIEKHVAKTFAVMSEDSSISDFGIVAKISDHAPIATIPRSDFPRLAEVAIPIEGPDDRRRFHDDRTKLVVIKAILERSSRRWQFAWNGIRISAPIKDENFFDKLKAKEFSFTQGEILDVMLRIHQLRDEANNIFINEKYEVMRVYGKEPAGVQTSLF